MKKKEIERKYWEWKEIERAVKFAFEKTWLFVDITRDEFVGEVESKLKKQFYKPPH